MPSIEERVRALLGSLRAGHVCTDVDDDAGNDPTVISASIELAGSNEIWRVLDRVPCDESAVKSAAEVVRREASEARARHLRALVEAAREKRSMDAMAAALATEAALVPTKSSEVFAAPNACGLWWVFMRGAEARLCHVRRDSDNRMRAYAVGWSWIGEYIWTEDEGEITGFVWVKCIAPTREP